MPVSNPQNTVFPTLMDCQGTAEVTLSFDASGELVKHPAFVVLVLDHSGSTGHNNAVEYMKSSAKKLVQTIALASGASAQGPIAGTTQVALVTFNDKAVIEVWPTNRVEELLAKIDALYATGLTNHYDAFLRASQLLSSSKMVARKMVLFTDGLTTVSKAPDDLAREIKRAGGRIYCIGMLDSPSQIIKWASTPTDIYVSHTDHAEQIERVFDEITAEVVEAGARDVEILEELNPDFRINRIVRTQGGAARITGEQTLLWRLDHAGVESSTTTSSLTFEIAHIGKKGGVKPVSRALTYRDRFGHKLIFPDSSVTVNCPEPGAPIPLVVSSCQDAVQFQVECTVEEQGP